MESLIFTECPEVTLATNKFVNVPIILQYENDPLIQIIKNQTAGYTTKISIYHPDGTYLAKVVGSRIIATSNGHKAGVTLEHPDRMTVCKLGNKILFEIKRIESAALKTTAELYAPDGYFIKYTHSPLLELLNEIDTGNTLCIGSMEMSGNTFSGCRIGIWIRQNGSIKVACA